MSLNLGTLTGFLDLDASAFDSALGGAADKLEGFSGKGAALAAGAGVAIGGAIAAGVLGAMNVEAANDKLAAQLGLNAAESERLGGVAGALYANAYGGSLAEVNTAVGAVVSSIAGMRTASSGEVEAMTAKVLDMATAFEVDVSRAAQVAGQAVSSGLATDAAAALDLLTASMQAVPAAVREDLLDAVDEYGPFMASIGLQGEAAFGLLVEAAEKGAFGIDKTGDALKEFTIRATDMSAASKVGYDSLGLSQEEMTAKLLAGGEVGAAAFEQIITGLQGMKDPTEQSTAALALFGTPLEDLSVTEIPAFLASLTGAQTALGDTAGAAERMGQTLNDNASTNIEAFKRGLTTTFVDVVGGAVLPAVDDVAKALATGLGPAFDAVTGFLSEHETAAKAVGIVLGTVALGLGAASLATSAWSITMGILNAVMAANPIGLVILVVAGLAAGLIYAYNESETFRDIVNGAFTTIKEGAGDAVGAMIDGFKGLLTVWLTVADGIVSGAATALGWIPGLGDKLQAANTAFDNMKDGILSTLDDAAQKAYGFGEKSGSNVASGIGSTSSKAYAAGGGLVNDLGRGVGAGGGTASSAGYAVGAAAGQGMVDGIASKRFAVAREAQMLAIAAGNAMRSGLQVRSPSRVTRQIGMFVGEGLALGMLDTTATVTAASARLGMSAVPTVPGASLSGIAGRGGDRATAPGRGGALVHIENMHVRDEQEAARELEARQRDAAALHGLAGIAAGA